MNIQATRRSAAYLLIAAAAAATVVVATLIPGLTPWSPAASAADQVAAQSCGVTYFALNPDDLSQPNPAKEVPAAFGSAVTARGEQAVKAELNERRECGSDGKFDPALTASHYAAWSEAGLTSTKVDYTGIDAFYAQIAADPGLYKKTVDELKKLEGESAYTEEGVPAGIWSLYMVPNGTGAVNVGQGRTSADGTNAVFTHGGAVVKYRLDCGFQVNRSGEFPGVPPCSAEQCPPPPPPPSTPPVTPPGTPECPPGSTGPYPHCDAKNGEATPDNDGWVPDGTGNGVTDGNQSSDQQGSGETRGNAGDDQVSSGTPGVTTPDTVPSDQGGPVGGGATPGGDSSVGVPQDTGNTSTDVGGTNGATDIGGPPAD